MDSLSTIALALDPGLILQAQGFQPDPWQQDFLLCQDRQVLLLCNRGAGKSRTTSALALHKALFSPQSLILVLSRAQRQAGEIFRYIKQGYNAIRQPIPLIKETETQLELQNGSRIVSLPGKEDTIRSYQGVSLIILDEAARIPDDLYHSVRPMLAVSKGRLIALTTPYGQRGWFYKEWHDEQAAWKRFKTTWRDCPRIDADFIEQELRSMGEAWVKQEYECEFTAMEGLVYPDFDRCIVPYQALPKGRPVGGIDFGWRNPFAALWGLLIDRDDTLWIAGERYLRETPLHEHSKALPKGFMWYADPAGRTEIEELRASGHTVRRGCNEIRLGIAAVQARIRTGRLKVFRQCQNLIAEAKLYRYPSSQEGNQHCEIPLDEHNHALGALRYLISKIDAKFMAKLRRKAPQEGPLEIEEAEIPTPDTDQDAEKTQRSVFRAKTWQDKLNEHDQWTVL